MTVLTKSKHLRLTGAGHGDIIPTTQVCWKGHRRDVHVLFSNVDVHVHGHGYADAHAFVRSFAAFPEHPGSNVSLWIIICRVIDAFEAGSF